MFEEKYGGLGLSPFLTVLAIEVMSEYCLGVATSAGAIKLGALPIEHGGTEEQKMKYLTPLAKGEKIAAFALTEPGAGSDVPNLKTFAEKKGDRYILNGTKQWITNAGVADFYTVFALTDKSKGPRGISCFIVEKGTKGLSFGKLEQKMGIRCSHTRQVILEDVEVPAENLVGLKPNMGFIHAIKTLISSRPFIATMGTGLATGAYKEALKYARQREQFGKHIINFQAVQHMLAEMATKIEAARLLAYRAAKYALNNHPEAARYSAMAKLLSSETAVQVCNDALQLHGGYGFTKDYPIEKMYRDAKILTIYEGTSQIQKNEIGAYCIKDAGQLK
jgi:alkylation response protein AidB-like acyl-CoA dehydrogenase